MIEQFPADGIGDNGRKNQLTKRQQQALKTKEDLYNAALDLFRTKGFEMTTIGDIVKVVGVATGSFYVHFKTKNHVIYHCMEQFDAIAERAFWSAFKEPSFERQLRRYLLLYYVLVRDTGKEVLNAYYQIGLQGEKVAINDEARPIFNHLSQMVELAIARGELSTTYQTAEYVHRIVISLQGVEYYWCTSDTEIDVLDLALAQGEVLLAALPNLPAPKSKDFSLFPEDV